ncbi:MAG: MazG family protein, partial [Oscillospiraceae bacterium]|nr:MazG family protein [Oscillospiraceae bacterium]
ICQKLIVRHPHVFGDVTAETSGEVLKNWNNIKQQTKGQETYYETLESVCTALPALMRAQKVGQRAKRAGMDFKDAAQVLDCLESEIAELKEAMAEGTAENIAEEMGDVLFSCVNLSRHLECDAEESLTRSTEKFMKRFKETEDLIRFDGIDMRSLNIDELDVYWRKAKTK